MLRVLKDKKGATSVLVIFMMIVLVVFATLAFTTSYANYRLAVKAANVTAENYALDDLASQMLLKIDSALAEAETQAQATLSQGGVQGQVPGIDHVQATAIQTAYAGARVRNTFLDDLMARTYMHCAVQALSAMEEQYGGLYMTLNAPYEDGNFFDFTRPAPDDGTLSMSIALTTGTEQGDKQLDVTIGILPARYQLSDEGSAGIHGMRAETYRSRYQIDVWKQWQIPFHYEDGLEFGDARISLEDMD